MKNLNTNRTIKDPTKILQDIRALIADDLIAFDELIQEKLSSNVPLIREIIQHIFKTKGKRLRPLLLILAAHAFSAALSDSA